MALPRSWRAYPEITLPPELLHLVDGNILIAQMLMRRGFHSPEAARVFLDPSAYIPASSLALPGMEKAVDRLRKAFHHAERICVWGDFDVDGQTATALLVSALRSLGANVSFHIPIRAQESHGISLPALQKQIETGVDLILTCDTGITAHEAVKVAAEQGIDTIITDHHALPAQLPPAYAIVSPRLLDETEHPLTTLPGVGVAYKLIEALLACFDATNTCQDYLDLVALGIVADAAILVKDTRYLLQRGLQKLQNLSRPGLIALLETAGIQAGSMNEETISFVIAPRLNAVGRLSDANPMVDFLTTSNLGAARMQAQIIESLNAQRKLLTAQIFKAALALIEREPALLEPAALVLNYPTWHAGVIGIIASRLVDYFHKPVVLFSSPQGEVARGSARSIPGIDITRAIASQAHLLVSFGGHPMAAGLSIQPENIAEFRQGLARAVEDQIAAAGTSTAEFENLLLYDAEIPLSALTPQFIEQIERLAPFGPGNPAPVLIARNLAIQSYQTIGEHEEHLLVRLVDPEAFVQDVIWWQAGILAGDIAQILPEGTFDLAYSVHSCDYKGQRSIQVEWIEARPAFQAALALQPKIPTRQVVDYRYVASPLEELRKLISNPGLQIWREGAPENGFTDIEREKCRDRFHLTACSSLVIWTIPPGRTEMIEALDRAKPQTVHFFGNQPDYDQPKAFMERLAGLIKYSLRHPDQPLTLSALAVALAHRLPTVQLGLTWLEARGAITIQMNEGGRIAIFPGAGQPIPDLKQVEARLRQALDETSAFRSYYLRADLNSLI